MKTSEIIKPIGKPSEKWLSDSKKAGCPTCNGNNPKSCMRCLGGSRLCDWKRTEEGWDWQPGGGGV